MTRPTPASATQVAGTHYKTMVIQPWDFIAANNLGWFEGEIVKYLSRWRAKNGVEDLRKARHLLDKLIELAVDHDWQHRTLDVDDLVELLGGVVGRRATAGDDTADATDGETRARGYTVPGSESPWSPRQPAADHVSVSPETCASAQDACTIVMDNVDDCLIRLAAVSKSMPPTATLDIHGAHLVNLLQGIRDLLSLTRGRLNAAHSLIRSGRHE